MTVEYAANESTHQPPNPAVPAPVMEAQKPVDTLWTCTTSLPEGDLSVGTKFQLICEGPAIALERENLGLELRKEQKYALKILETKSLSETRAEFIATTWTAGEVKVVNAVLSDGKKRVGLGEVKLQVQSVLDPQTNPEMKAFGPWSPMKLAWPGWVWISLLVALAFLLLALFLRLRVSLRRKKLLKLLEKNPISISPYHHFNKELRRISKQLPVSGQWSKEESQAFLKELSEATRWYLARELTVATFGRSAQDITRDLKRLHPAAHKLLARDLRIAIGEIQKAMSGNQMVAVDDAVQLTELARGLAEKIREMKEKR